jgi:methionyl-tRNA synthetase
MARILITSALPGINGVKHLGNLVGSLLPADVYARFQRARGHEVLAICGTDDHGTPAELAAAELGQDIFTYCEEQHRIQDDLGLRYGLSWDLFGRTSTRHTGELVHHFAAALEARGLIEERVDKMIYSLVDKRFLPDRYVEGTCPVCGFRPARGDQCDNCGSLLDPVDLIDPYSVISRSSDLEVRETRHLYQLHSQMADRIRAWVAAKTEWATLPRAITYKHLDEGLIDRGITRDLAWGFPVLKDGLPRPGFESKVYYVWFDEDRLHRHHPRVGRPGGRRLGTLVAHRQGRGRRPLRAVHGQGQRALPLGLLPLDHPGFGGAVEAGGRAEGVQLAQLVRRQVLHLGQARRLHGPGARAASRRLLALVPHGQ